MTVTIDEPLVTESGLLPTCNSGIAGTQEVYEAADGRSGNGNLRDRLGERRERVKCGGPNA
jgi:hypothetical protein